MAKQRETYLSKYDVIDSNGDVVATYKSIYNKIRSYYEFAGFASHSHITDFNMEFDLIQNQKPSHLFLLKKK